MTMLLRPLSAAQNYTQSRPEDPRILYLKATDLMHRGQEVKAGELLVFLVAQKLSPDLKRLVHEDLAVLSGKGPRIKRFEYGVNRFFREAADPALAGGMAAGQLVFAPLRAGILHSLWNPTARKYFLGSLGSRFFAAGVASAMEAPVFWAVGKGIEQRMYHGGGVSWDLRDGIKEMASLGATMGVLRLSGFGARTILPGLIRFYPSVIFGAASVGGLYLAHWGQEQVGWRENYGNWNRLTDALVGTFQFGMTGAAVHRLLGTRFQNFNARLEYLSERRENSPPRFPQIFSGDDPSLALVGGVSCYRMTEKQFSEKPQTNLAKATDTPSHGGKILDDPVQIFIWKVLQNGNQAELNKLKNLVFEAYRRLGFQPSERLFRYFNSKDGEAWKSGVSIITLGQETTPSRVTQALRENAEFAEFQTQWESRPHFRHPGQIEVRNHGNIFRPSSFFQKFLERMFKFIYENPTQPRVNMFLHEGLGILRSSQKSGEIIYEWQHVQSPSGSALSIGRVQQVGILMEFTRNEFLRTPIHVFPAPPSEWVKAAAERFKLEGKWEIPPIPVPGPRPKPPSKKKPKDNERHEVRLEYFSGTHGGFSFHQVERIIRAKLSKNPHEKIVNVIRNHYEHREYWPLPEMVNLAGGEKVYVLTFLYGGVKNGLVMRFDSTGKLLSPVYLGNNLGSEWAPSTVAALQAGTWPPVVSSTTLAPSPRTESPPTPAPIPAPAPAPISPDPAKSPPEPPFVPSADDSPSTFALRLIHESQLNTEARQLKLIKGLENLLQSPQTLGFGQETVARVWGMTKDITSMGQAAVRKYDLDGLKDPLIIYRPPIASMPEPWSKLFAQALRAEIQKSGKPELMVELGSDTGWLSLYLQKLGLADFVVGMDPREMARSVAHLNHSINASKGFVGRYENIEGWEQFGQLPRPSLVTAILPATDHPLRKSEWSFMAGTLQNGLTYLDPNGRIILGVEKVGDALRISDLFKQFGYVSSMLPLTDSGSIQGTGPVLLEGSVQK